MKKVKMFLGKCWLNRDSFLNGVLGGISFLHDEGCLRVALRRLKNLHTWSINFRKAYVCLLPLSLALHGVLLILVYIWGAVASVVIVACCLCVTIPCILGTCLVQWVNSVWTGNPSAIDWGSCDWVDRIAMRWSSET